MLKQGFSLSEGIEFLFLYLEKRTNEEAHQILQELESGASLDEVLKNLGFSNAICAQIFFAQSHGNVPQALMDAGLFLQQRKIEQQKLFKALQYPLILFLFFNVLLWLLQQVLMPQFETLYATMGYSPSGISALFLSTMKTLPYILLISVIFLGGGGGFVYKFRNTLSPTTQVDIFLKVPILSYYLKSYLTHFFTRELSFLLKSGLSINEAMSVFQNQSFRPFFQQQGKWIKNQLEKGMSFPETLEKVPYFVEELPVVVRHGERNSFLEKELHYFSQFCLDSMEKKSEKLLQWLQPIVFGAIGLFVVMLYLSLMLPMYQMMQNI